MAWPWSKKKTETPVKPKPAVFIPQIALRVDEQGDLHCPMCGNEPKPGDKKCSADHCGYEFLEPAPH